MYLWKSNVCSHKLDLQEANVSVSQFHRIGFFFRWMLVCEWTDAISSQCEAQLYTLKTKKRWSN